MRPQKPTDIPACLRRRTVLTLGPVCLVATLTGCATEPERDPPIARTPATADSSTGTPSAPTTPPTTSNAAPRVLADTKTIPIGGGRVISGILVTQPLEGMFVAFDAHCPHLGALVSPPRGGVITCNVHGSTFVDMDGSWLSGPAPRGLKEIPVVVEGTKIITV